MTAKADGRDELLELLTEQAHRAAEELLAEEQARAPAVAELAAEQARRAELLVAFLRAAAADKEATSPPLQ